MSKKNIKVDCYSAGDRGFMRWGQRIRAKLLEPVLTFLMGLGITANQLTILSTVIGLTSCPLLYVYKPLALCMLFLHVLLDGLDGPLARRTGKASSRGSFSDTMSDQLIITATTITLIHAGVVNIIPGTVYFFSYAVIIGFSMVRNALSIPYSWLLRPRFFIYTWLIIEFYLLPGTINHVLWFFNFILCIKMISGFIKIRRKM